jgi:hypothetical protein
MLPAPVPQVRANAVPPRVGGSVVQQSKKGRGGGGGKKKKNDDEEAYVPYWEKPKKKQRRFNFRTKTPQSVIKKTAHRVVHFDVNRYRAVYTCPACKRVLALIDLNGVFHLTEYGYESKSGKTHRLRSLQLDHYPELWKDRLVRFKKDGTPWDDQRREYQDEDGLRALCKVCNESHQYETQDVNDYDSDSEDDKFEPRRTPSPERTHNTGSFSGYRDQTWLSNY